jgi:hypothetical protein
MSEPSVGNESARSGPAVCRGEYRHLLESIDGYAMRDLVDLSKGAHCATLLFVDRQLKECLAHVEQCGQCSLNVP